MDMSAAVAANLSSTQMKLATQMVKMDADMQAEMAQMLQSVASVPASSTLGTAVNLTA